MAASRGRPGADDAPLPKPLAKTLLEVVIEKYPRAAMVPRAMPVRISKYHAVARELDGLLKPDAKHQGVPTVRGFNEVVLKVGETSRVRVLRLLHTLFTAVERNGHRVRLRESTENTEWQRGRRALEILVDGEAIHVTLREHLVRKLHEKTADEKRWSFLGRAYDLSPSGRLLLDLRVPWKVETRTSWRDTATSSLEAVLGEVVWTVDEAARCLITHRMRVAEEARQAELARKLAEEIEHARRTKAAEAKARLEEKMARDGYKSALERDLRRMARRWSSARQIRGFLGALQKRVPPADRGEGFQQWLTWAEQYAEGLDPMNAPEKIAKEVEPDLAQLRAARRS